MTLSNARLNVIRARNNRRIAQSYLNLLLNRNIDLAIRPETEFPMPPISRSLPYFQDLALASRPDLKSMMTRVKQAQSAVRLVKSSYYPHVALSLNYRDLSDNSFENDSANVLVTANWSIFEWNKRKWQVSAEKARFEQALILENQLKQQIPSRGQNSLPECKSILQTNLYHQRFRCTGPGKIFELIIFDIRRQVATSTDVIDAPNPPSKDRGQPDHCEN